MVQLQCESRRSQRSSTKEYAGGFWLLNEVFVWNCALRTCVSLVDRQALVYSESRTIRSIRQSARQFCSSLMNCFSSLKVFGSLASLVLFKQQSLLCDEIANLAVENDSLHHLYIRSFENTCWGLAGGRFAASGRLRGGLWEASWSHLEALGSRLRLCGSVLEGQLTSRMLYIDFLSPFGDSRTAFWSPKSQKNRLQMTSLNSVAV